MIIFIFITVIALIAVFILLLKDHLGQIKIALSNNKVIFKKWIKRFVLAFVCMLIGIRIFATDKQWEDIKELSGELISTFWYGSAEYTETKLYKCPSDWDVESAYKASYKSYEKELQKYNDEVTRIKKEMDTLECKGTGACATRSIQLSMELNRLKKPTLPQTPIQNVVYLTYRYNWVLGVTVNKELLSTQINSNLLNQKITVEQDPYLGKCTEIKTN